jgi:DNA-binding transcriptional ArsR family regulator
MRALKTGLASFLLVSEDPLDDILPAGMSRERLRDLILLRGIGMQQEEAANAVGVSQQTASRYMRTLREAALASGNPVGFAKRALGLTIPPPHDA